MHTVHIVLVEADSEAEAYEKVARKLESQPEWSDWHNANGTPPFAGRWTNGVFLTEAQMKEINERSADDPEVEFSDVPNILCYADDPELAEYTLARFASDVKQEMRECMPAILDVNSLIDEYSSYSKDSVHSSMEVWQLKRVLQLLSGEWTPDSRFYDLETYCASLFYFFERCEKEPHRQYLVPVDFHF